MALDFPNNPVDGQVYDNYFWDADTDAWRSIGSTSVPDFLTNATISTASLADVPLRVDGIASQAANLQEWRNASGTVLSSISASGGLTLNNALTVGNGGTGTNSLASGAYLKGAGTSAITTQAIPIPISDGGTSATSVKGAIDALGISVVQTKSTIRNSQLAVSSTSWYEVPSFEINIAPKYSTSKVLLTISGTVGYSAAGVVALLAVRNGSGIGVNDQNNATRWIAPRSGDHTAAFTMQVLDSPGTTSNVRYSMYMRVLGNTALLGGIWNGNPTYTSITTMTAMEII